MTSVYDHPEYYEIAFSFRDIRAEVDVFEECLRRFSRIPVRSVLELGCGNSPHMIELARRGYQYSGLDLSEAMLEYSSQKASEAGVPADLVRADMLDFSLDATVDFVYVLLGSLCAKNTDDLVTHLQSVGRVLRPGGLYLLDWCVQYDPPWGSEAGDTWELEGNGVRVRTTVFWEVVNKTEQTFMETIILDVDDHGTAKRIVGRERKRAIYPQEFLCLIDRSPDFEFVGWWNHWDLSQPLEEADRIDRPITLLRRAGRQGQDESPGQDVRGFRS
jgi:SAM-dependent methyltransferase